MPRRKHISTNAEESSVAVAPPRPMTRDRLRRAIVRDLSMQERLLLVLAYAERMNTAEIACTLNMLPNQVDSLRADIEARLGDLVKAA